MDGNLKNCTGIEIINLGSNKLIGEIPAWLGDLSRLKAIRLQKNSFSGMIPPSLTNLSALKEISFTYNQLQGSIPTGLGSFSRLEFLSLGANHLSGTIPTTLFNLSSLTKFTVTMNELHGTLPHDLGAHLPNLQYLLLGINHFTGSLPASLTNATKVYSLDISFNNFTGSVPPEIGKLCPDFLSFDMNQLTATIPEDWKFLTFLTNCSRIRILDLQDNRLGAMLPSSVSNLSAHLDVLYVGYNEISGKIPSGISNLLGLTQLQFSFNHFIGPLPDSIGKLSSLEALGFNNNELTGLLPSSLGNLTKLLRLYTSDNKFEGSLRTNVGRLHALTEAIFDNNKFTGPLPAEIFNLSSLSYALILSGIFFVGPLPPEVGKMTKVAYMYFSRNNLSGQLPDALSNCRSLIDLRLDSNSFNGSIPASMGKMRGLILLNLTNNTLSGAIPQDIGSMSGMKELYLSHNNLSGVIPESLESMTSLYKLDLSFNLLTGEVPSHGVFSNSTGFLFAGNRDLCGGILELHLPPCLPTSVRHSKSKFGLIFKLLLPIGGILLGLCFVLISISLRNKANAQSTTLVGSDLTDDKYPRVSYAELAQGTNGFHKNNMIGTGRYGSVYKCSLLLNNRITTVAVKVFDLQQSGSSKSFVAECKALNKIRHRNLISVITCCSSSDMKQNDFKALVFQFMPNGSLHKWLHPDNPVSQQLQSLTLMQRLNIAVDVADALDYLHNNCEPPIVHCDLKPSNILLNEDLVAHVGDFGLAKILLSAASEQLIISASTTGIRGTIGYVAPEYGEGGQVSPSGDVYSFGIVILELFTGLTPTHDMFKDGLTLQKHAQNALSGTLMKIVDPAILSIEEVCTSNFQRRQNVTEDLDKLILSIIKLALSCSRQVPTERISMRDAAAELMRIRKCHVKTKESTEEPIQ